MNVLVTGANGQLGNEMRIVSKESAHSFIFTDVVQIEDQKNRVAGYYRSGGCAADGR